MVKYKVRKMALKSVKISLLLCTVIDADHQISCLFTNKSYLLSPLWALIGVQAKSHV